MYLHRGINYSSANLILVHKLSIYFLYSSVSSVVKLILSRTA